MPRPRSTRTSCAPLRFHRVDRPGIRRNPATPRLRIVGAPGAVRPRLHHRRRLPVRRRGGPPRAALGVSEILLALVIAPIATELPEKFNSLIWVRQGKDTLAMGNITGAMVFQSAIPTVVALVLAGDAWHVDEDSLIAFLSAGIAFLVGRGDLRPDVAPRPPRRPLAARRRGAVPRVPRDRRRSRSRACCRSADPGPIGRDPRPAPEGANRPMLDSAGHEAGAARRRTSPGADPCSPSSRPTPRPEAAPAAARARRGPDRLLRGRVRPAAGRQGQHHDPRVHVRDRDLRGHPRLLERRAGDALRPVRPGAPRAHPQQRQDAADGEPAVRWTSWSRSSSRRSAATTTARTSTSARRSTRAPRRSASGSTTSITSCT